MEYPIRKQLRLKGYDYAQNNAYFITICTNHQMHLFGEIMDQAVGAAPCGRPIEMKKDRKNDREWLPLNANLNDAGKMVEKWLLKTESKYTCVKIDGYVIMPNHIHFVIFNMREDARESASLPQIIGWFKTMTTNDYIKGVKNRLCKPFHKHLRQRNYYEHVIRNEKDLNEIRKYIVENPLKWTLDEYYNNENHKESGSYVDV
ncbi:MAG TPA: transposase [Oscillospiraceae bacterium]|nr:transposase [Oscillospiraceae bacterium]HPF55062.1 transposase [Clostridiales bacterium]HPK34879.1 transposase [Oscillospiraceae bacterium]HPR76157.1 transposase [Oscillospiraceae bacterium]